MPMCPKLSAIVGLNNHGEISIPTTESSTVDWRIPDFFTTLELVHSLDSPSFQLKNIPLKIKLFQSLNKNSQNLEKWFEVCLRHADDLTSMTHLICEIGIKRNDGFVFKLIELKGESHGVYLLPVSEFIKNRHDLAIDGYVTFFLKFLPEDGNIQNNSPIESTRTVSVDLRRVSSTSSGGSTRRCGMDTLSKNMKDLYLKEEHCDITIQVEERQFKAHKSILSARSPVFSSKMHDMAVENNNTLEVTVCKPATFNEFLLYVYSGKVETLSDGNVVGLYEVSNEYGVEDLKADCVDYMNSNLSVDLFCDAVKLAASHDESELLALSKEYFKKNTKKILMSAKWQSFLKENSTLGNELFLLMVPDD